MEERALYGDIEETLLARIARGDAGAFESLYDRLGRAVYSLVLTILRNPHTAQEVTQEVFLTVWRSASEFDPRRGKARTWVLSLAHHKSVDAVRRLRLRAAEALDESLPDPADVAAQAMQTVEHQEVRRGLDLLPAAQREAIGLAYYGGLTQQEIAVQLGIPLGTVKTRMRDGMLRLRRALAGTQETPS